MGKTYFAGIRRWSAVIAILVPLLWWLAFLLVALGAGYWALAPLVLGMIAAVSFPLGTGYRGVAKMRDQLQPQAVGKTMCLRWLPRVATVLIYFWLIRQPEFSSFCNRIFGSGKPLREWPIFAASLILMGTAMCRNWYAVKRLTDEDIFEFFEEKGKKKTER